jgi:hypothetical protein
VSLDNTSLLLKLALEAAVPLWMEMLSCLPFEELQARARKCGDVVAHQGDIIQFKSKKKGETAAAFNKLAEGLACLAFAPGGVKFLGCHWIAHHVRSEVR